MRGSPVPVGIADTPRLTRRAVLSLGGLAAFLAGCGPGSASSRGYRTLTDIRAVTYLTPSYEDLYPAIEAFADTVTATGDEVTIDLFNSGALLNAEQSIPGLMRGVADIVFTTSSYVSASYPILGAYELPFVNDGFEQNRRALPPDGPLHELINGQLRPRGIELLASMPTTVQWVFTVDRPVRTPADMRGLRIRTAGHVEGQTVRALGGSPVSMSSAELYEAFERGTIDGMLSYMGTVISRDLQHVLRYGTEAHFGAYSVDAYANAEWFASIAPETQRVLQGAAEAYFHQGTENQAEVHAEEYRPLLENSGMELVQLDAAEIGAFKDATAAVIDWWHDKIGDRALSDRALELVRQA